MTTNDDLPAPDHKRGYPVGQLRRVWPAETFDAFDRQRADLVTLIDMLNELNNGFGANGITIGVAHAVGHLIAEGVHDGTDWPFVRNVLSVCAKKLRERPSHDVGQDIARRLEDIIRRYSLGKPDGMSDEERRRRAIGLPGPRLAAGDDGGELLTIRVSRETAAQVRDLALRWGVQATVMSLVAPRETDDADIDLFRMLATLFDPERPEGGAA